MRMGCPSWGESLSVTVRAMMSVPLPGVNGTMILIDFAGHACACAPTCRAQSASVAIDLPSFPDTLASSTWNPSGLRFLRRFRLSRTVEGDRLANERLEGGFVNLFSFVDVDRAACVSVETRIEETGGILQRRTLQEGKLHDVLIGFASADDPIVRPDRSAHPLPLLDDVRVCILDELAHSAEGFPAPVPEVGDSFRDELRCRPLLARARLFHALILAMPSRADPSPGIVPATPASVPSANAISWNQARPKAQSSCARAVASWKSVCTTCAAAFAAAIWAS